MSEASDIAKIERMLRTDEDRYFLKADHSKVWQEVTKEQFMEAEQAAGFIPKFGRGHVATGGFGGRGMNGRVISAFEVERGLPFYLEHEPDFYHLVMCGSAVKDAVARIESFLEVWPNPYRSDVIYGILSRPDEDLPRELLATDLRIILDALK